MAKDGNDLAVVLEASCSTKSELWRNKKKYLKDVSFQINPDLLWKNVLLMILSLEEKFQKSKDIFCPWPFCIRLTVKYQTSHYLRF